MSVRRELLAVLRWGRVLRPGGHATAAPAARTAALDAHSDRAAGAGLPAGRHPAGAGDRPVAAGGGQRGAGRPGADLQPGRPARLDRAAADERNLLHLRVDRTNAVKGKRVASRVDLRGGTIV